jgi:hypothetical protein
MSATARIAAATLVAGIAAATLATPAAAKLAPPFDVPATRLDVTVRPPVCNSSARVRMECPVTLPPYEANVL